MSQEERKPLSVQPDSSMADLETSPTIAATPRPTTGQWGRLEIGTVVAQRYRILGTLGVGGMGVVYRAHDETLGVDIALKVLRPEVAHDEGFLQRFRHELVVARRITHRNVIRIHDLGVHMGMHFMTMDMVEGRSLRQIMKRKGALPLSQALKILRQVTGALAEAHRQGVIHRDLKPENILIDEEGEAYVTDFGIARSVDTPGLTRTGEIIGTPDYLSPEQAKGEKVDGRSDLYTLGLIFVEMLSGKLPFEGGTLFEVLAQRMTVEPKTLVDLGVEAPPPIADIATQLTSRVPEQRFESAEKLLRALDDFEQPPARAVGKRGRRIVVWAFGAALVAGLLSFALARWWWPETSPIPTGMDRPIASIAVLPFLSLAEGEPWPGVAAAAALSLELTRASDLRVLEPIEVLRVLEGLGFPTTSALRNDQLSRLYQVLGVSGLIVGEVEKTSSNAKVELRYLVEGPSGLEPQRLGEPISVGSDQLAEASVKAGQAIYEHLGRPQPDRPSGSAIALGAWHAFAQGLESVAHRDAERAVSFFEQALDIEPRFALAWLRLAQVQGELGLLEKAAQSGQAAIQHASDDRQELVARILVGDLSGDHEDSSWVRQHEDLQKRLIERFPFDMTGYRAYARCLGEQGRFEEAMAVLERAVEIDGRDSEAWFMLGRFALLLSKNQLAVDEYLVRALVRRTRLRDEVGQAEVHNALGVAYERLGLVDEALDSFESAAEIRHLHDDQAGLAAILFNLASIHLMRGDRDQAEDNLDKALTIHTELGNLSGIAKLHNARGVLEEERGRYGEALEAYRRALQVGKELDDAWAMAESHTNVGYAYFLLNEFDNAVLHLEEALDLNIRGGSASGEMLALQGLGFCQLAQGQWAEAVKSFSKTLDLSGKTGRRDAAAVALGNLGRLAHLKGHYGEALASYDEALEILQALGDQRGQIEFQLYLAEAFLDLGDLEAAADRWHQVHQLQVLKSLPEQQVHGLILKGHLSLARGEFEAARLAFDEALIKAQASDRVRLAAQAKAGVGEVAIAEGQSEQAVQNLAQVYQVAEELRDALLQLRAGERLAEARLQQGDSDEVVVLSRQILDQIDMSYGYARAYRVRALLAKALAALGQREAAEREWKIAGQLVEALREVLEPKQRELFDRRLDVRELSDEIQ